MRIGQNLLNKVPMESSTFVDFADYHLNRKLKMESLMGPARVIYMGPYKPKTTKAVN